MVYSKSSGVDMQDAAVGRAIHGHKLLERIGGGHYGEVWRAEYLGHEVALKVFTGGRRMAHLRREVFAQYALGRLDGEDARWFPRVEHIDLDADPPYIRMELVQGTPLENLLANPALSLEERLAIGERVLEALSAVHRHDFVHGDLSPLNVLVTPDRSVRLIDVGYGALFEEAAGDIAISTTSEDQPAGVASPLYSAPERFRSAEMLEGCGKPADIFSFGKLLYRLITGEQPFVIKPVSLKFRALGPRWDEFLFKCLEERPEARFADAAAALAEYRRIYRPELAAGEYRAECPECRAAQSIPGGWAGERFGCRGCARTLEVLFYDDASRYATTALVSEPRETVPPILFLDHEADPRARKHCVRCGGEMRVEARKCRHCGAWVEEQAKRVIEASARTAPASAPAAARSFVLPAIAVFFAYWLFWLPGAILNWFLLEEARKVQRRTGRAPAGLLGLQVLMALFVTLPLVLCGTLLVLGLVGGLLAAALA